MKKKMIIIIENGLLDSVYANFIDEDIEVELVDKDTEFDNDDVCERNQELLNEIEEQKFKQIYE